MEERTNFSFREYVTGYFFPFKNRGVNLSICVLAVALATPLAVSNNNYQRDVKRYHNGEISREPKPSDYFAGRLDKWAFDHDPIDGLEKWLFDNEEETNKK